MNVYSLTIIVEDDHKPTPNKARVKLHWASSEKDVFHTAEDILVKVGRDISCRLLDLKGISWKDDEMVRKYFPDKDKKYLPN